MVPELCHPSLSSWAKVVSFTSELCALISRTMTGTATLFPPQSNELTHLHREADTERL